jgi:saccharopine dehydrogenase (NAD+, L-glutamate forming)
MKISNGQLLVHVLTLTLGRSLTKLNHVATKLKINVPMIVADSDNLEALENMSRQTKVLLSTVGPYAKYGLKVVEACVNSQTDYVDLTGEPQFIKLIIEKFHDKAVQNSTLIINSCGTIHQ